MQLLSPAPCCNPCCPTSSVTVESLLETLAQEDYQGEGDPNVAGVLPVSTTRPASYVDTLTDVAWYWNVAGQTWKLVAV